jgi:hypothetical protein
MDALSIVAAAAAMLVVKLGGSAAFLALVRRLYDEPPRSVLFAALLRMGLGLVGTGGIALVAFAVGLIGAASGGGPDAWWVAAPFAIGAQAIFRFVAWMATLVIAYDPSRRKLGRDASVAIGGVVFSFLLDIPIALLALADLFFLLRDTRFC